MVVLGTQSKFRAWKWILHTQIDLRKVASTTWTSFTLNVIEANYISALIMVLILLKTTIRGTRPITLRAQMRNMGGGVA